MMLVGKGTKIETWPVRSQLRDCHDSYASECESLRGDCSPEKDCLWWHWLTTTNVSTNLTLMMTSAQVVQTLYALVNVTTEQSFSGLHTRTIMLYRLIVFLPLLIHSLILWLNAQNVHRFIILISQALIVSLCVCSTVYVLLCNNKPNIIIIIIFIQGAHSPWQFSVGPANYNKNKKLKN